MARFRAMGLFLVLLACACASSCVRQEEGPRYTTIEEFSPEMNERIRSFLMGTRGLDQRKVATLDCDGTLLGQVPYYLADLCLYHYAVHTPTTKTRSWKG